jgi:hypothetical protein
MMPCDVVVLCDVVWCGVLWRKQGGSEEKEEEKGGPLRKLHLHQWMKHKRSNFQTIVFNVAVASIMVQFS